MTLTTISPWKRLGKWFRDSRAALAGRSKARTPSPVRRATPTVEQLEGRRLLDGAPPRFITPLGGVPYQDWTIAEYVDHDSGSPNFVDYRGGAYTYDGHTGTDFSIKNFAQMDAGVPVYAAADGVVFEAHDGEYDRQTDWSHWQGNMVVIDHGNGYTSLYNHLREGSVSVVVGQAVKAGDQIGLVGSSGLSGSPHLHFEVRKDYFATIVDPFQDPATYWVNPLPYAGDTTAVLDAGLTNYEPLPDVVEQPSGVSVTNQAPDQASWMWVSVKGVKAGDAMDFRWYRPDGSLYYHTPSVAPEITSGWWQSGVGLPYTPDLGTWQVAFTINDVELVRRSFTVTTAGAPEVKVSQDSTYILDGRTTPIDFGSAALGSAAPTFTFTVLNHGSSPLTTGGLSVPAGFSVVEGLATSIAAGASDTFTVALATTATGYRVGSPGTELEFAL